ncbi:hypothetical protein GGQ10_000929 [Salinibacter ruber]|uniref:sulfotransferase family protein n=1 Tax=Salinibacter ruber TaxID=146919 RepID=UPI0021682D90|nr:sulfotransferase [Salinibacter ruber]MCS4086130.1 hypothetical protein [Salinibacter ruber]
MGLDTPFLIIGAGSSGTTLLSTILDSHPRLACGPELSLFNKRDIYRDFEYVKSNFDKWMRQGLSTDGQAEYRVFLNNLDAYYQDQESVLDLVAKSSSLREFSDDFFQSYLEERGKDIWGLKAGSNSYCIEEFMSLYPNSKIIHLTRDGRDSVCSLEKRSNSLFHSVSHWLFNVCASIRERGKDHYLEVKYEDIVSTPEQQIGKIFSHIGVEFSRADLKKENSYWYSHADGNVHSSWGQSPFEKITDESVGRHLAEMSNQARALFYGMRLTPHARRLLGVNYRCSGQLMEVLGYEGPSEKTLPPVDLDHFRIGVSEYISRSKREAATGGTFWKPLTWVSPMHYFFPVQPGSPT